MPSKPGLNECRSSGVLYPNSHYDSGLGSSNWYTFWVYCLTCGLEVFIGYNLAIWTASFSYIFFFLMKFWFLDIFRIWILGFFFSLWAVINFECFFKYYFAFLRSLHTKSLAFMWVLNAFLTLAFLISKEKRTVARSSSNSPDSTQLAKAQRGFRTRQTCLESQLICISEQRFW